MEALKIPERRSQDFFSRAFSSTQSRNGESELPGGQGLDPHKPGPPLRRDPCRKTPGERGSDQILARFLPLPPGSLLWLSSSSSLPHASPLFSPLSTLPQTQVTKTSVPGSSPVPTWGATEAARPKAERRAQLPRSASPRRSGGRRLGPGAAAPSPRARRPPPCGLVGAGRPEGGAHRARPRHALVPQDAAPESGCALCNCWAKGLRIKTSTSR